MPLGSIGEHIVLSKTTYLLFSQVVAYILLLTYIWCHKEFLGIFLTDFALLIVKHKGCPFHFVFIVHVVLTPTVRKSQNNLSKKKNITYYNMTLTLMTFK